MIDGSFFQGDQAEIVPDFRDPEIQDHACEAIQRFVPRVAAT